jgi:hypothetical protein
VFKRDFILIRIHIVVKNVIHFVNNVVDLLKINVMSVLIH